MHTHTCVYYLPLSVYIPKIYFLDLLCSRLLPRSLHAVQYITYITWYTILHIPLLYITIQYTFTYLWPYYVSDNSGKWGCMCGHYVYVHMYMYEGGTNILTKLTFYFSTEQRRMVICGSKVDWVHQRHFLVRYTDKAIVSSTLRSSFITYSEKQPLSEDLKCLSHQVCSTCERR